MTDNFSNDYESLIQQNHNLSQEIYNSKNNSQRAPHRRGVSMVEAPPLDEQILYRNIFLKNKSKSPRKIQSEQLALATITAFKNQVIRDSSFAASRKKLAKQDDKLLTQDIIQDTEIKKAIQNMGLSKSNPSSVSLPQINTTMGLNKHSKFRLQPLSINAINRKSKSKSKDKTEKPTEKKKALSRQLTKLLRKTHDEFHVHQSKSANKEKLDLEREIRKRISDYKLTKYCQNKKKVIEKNRERKATKIIANLHHLLEQQQKDLEREKHERLKRIEREKKELEDKRKDDKNYIIKKFLRNQINSRRNSQIREDENEESKDNLNGTKRHMRNSQSEINLSINQNQNSNSTQIKKTQISIRPDSTFMFLPTLKNLTETPLAYKLRMQEKERIKNIEKNKPIGRKSKFRKKVRSEAISPQQSIRERENSSKIVADDTVFLTNTVHKNQNGLKKTFTFSPPESLSNSKILLSNYGEKVGQIDSIISESNKIALQFKSACKKNMNQMKKFETEYTQINTLINKMEKINDLFL